VRKKELGGKRGRTGREIRAGAKKKREGVVFSLLLLFCYTQVGRVERE
jgi:hypothetical protein